MLLLVVSFLLLFPFMTAFQPIIKTLTSADGTRIFADAIGNSTKSSIVFVHGFGLSGIVFDRFFTNQRLRNNFFLVRYDMRGHGRSDKPIYPDAYASVRYAEDFTAVSEAFDLKKPLFVGWSLGAGIIADIVANISPLPILGAVALDGVPFGGPDVLPLIAKPAFTSTLPYILQDNNVTESLEARIQFVDALFQNPQDVPFSLKMEYLGQTSLQPPSVSTLVTMRPQDRTKLLAAGDAGTLQLQVLFGGSDAMVSEDAVVNLLKPHFSNLVVSTVPGGHAVFEDNPDGTVDALAKFIQQISSRSEVSV